MISSKIILALVLSSTVFSIPVPASHRSFSDSHRDSHRSSRTSRRTSHRTSRSSNTHRTSQTSQGIHDDHQHHLQGLNAAAQQQHFIQQGQVQQQQHQVHVVNAVHNQGWVAPAHQNPVTMQPLTVVNPPNQNAEKKRKCMGLSCAVMKRDVIELEGRDFEEVEVRGLEELD